MDTNFEQRMKQEYEDLLRKYLRLNQLLKSGQALIYDDAEIGMLENQRDVMGCYLAILALRMEKNNITYEVIIK